MSTLKEYLDGLAAKGVVFNLMFESWVHAHITILRKVVEFLEAEGIPYELIGGSAVAIHVAAVDRDEVIPTQDGDLMVNRSDLERITQTASQYGFTFRHAAGLDMLLYAGETKAIKGVRLVFSGERVKASQAVANPPLNPRHIPVEGTHVAVIPLPDLIRMKLSGNRDKDRVHIRNMDAVGLIGAEIEAALPFELKQRLANIRETE